MLATTKQFYEKTVRKLRNTGHVSSCSEVHAGSRRGCALSPQLFFIYMSEVVGEVCSTTEGLRQ